MFPNRPGYENECTHIKMTNFDLVNIILMSVRLKSGRKWNSPEMFQYSPIYMAS